MSFFKVANITLLNKLVFCIKLKLNPIAAVNVWLNVNKVDMLCYYSD